MGLGIKLQEVRLEQGLTIDDLAQRTKIRPQYLEAIEAEDFRQLPGEAYVRPFLLSYAKALNVEEMVKTELQLSQTTTAELSANMKERRRKTRRTKRFQFVFRLSLLLLALGGAIYLIYWYFFV